MSTISDEQTAAARGFPIIRVFGGVSVDDVDGPVSIGGPRQRRLLALLAIRAGSVVSIDWLAEYLWNDDERPAATARALRTYLSRLRQALPTAAQEWIETEPAGYRLAAPDDALEHRRFAALRAAATEARERDDPQTALRHLDDALASWSGDPFRELEDLDWALAEIEQLRLDRLEMLEERWEVSLALGRHTQITGELATFTAEHGLRDRAARQFALALYRSGRTAEALRVIDDHRRRLADETGLDPTPAIVELEQAMLVGDPSLDAERVGRPLRGYRLLEEAGSGAFAIVWRCIQPSVEREVAIKQIRAELASQPDFIRRFEAEAHLVARVEHPHIVPLIDYWRDPDSAYLVMRWMRGGTLERRLDDGPLDVDDTLTLARQIGGALATAHAHGVVHRDVKTGNILFDEAGNAFLGDFGIALEAAESDGPEAALSPGSPAYSSPEQIRREPLGPGADVFSLGVVVFECLAGMLPFRDSSSLDELLGRQLNDPYPMLSDLRSEVPLHVADAVARATAKEPSERFADIAGFLAALDAPVAPEPATPSAAEPATPPGDLENPYLGLRAFDDADADRFFGRDRLVSELLDRLDDGTIRSRCVVIVGPSGSGKSSLARAGVVPAIRAGAVPGSSDWYVSTMVPGNDPFESLETALLRIAVNPPVTLLDQLRDGERGILRSVRRCLASDLDRVLLVIDQFEELFVGASADVAHDFLRALATTVEDPTSPVRVVITLRADFYDRPLAHPQFAPVLKETAVDVTPLAPDELERAVVEPARRVGVELEPGLAARIAAESMGQPAPLPLLQYALAELFERRDGSRLTVAAYDEIGGLTGALAARAESIHADADDAQRAAIRRAFGRMTDPGEASADLRRRVAVGDLGDDDETAWALERYGAARLITFGRDEATRVPTVEVAHEALLREWPRLAGWLRDDVETLRLAQAIGGAADAWDRSDRPSSDLYRGGRLDTAIGLAMASPERLRPLDREFLDASRAAADREQAAERRRVRRLRRLVVVTGIALVVAVVAGAVALIQRNDAQSAQREAELATLISRSAAVGTEDPELALLLALEANRRAPERATEQAVLDALGATTIANRVSSLAPLSEFDGPCEPVSMTNSDGTLSFATVDGQLVGRDTVSGDVVEYGPPPEPCVIWMADREADRRWATTFDGTRMWFGPYGGPWGPARTIDTPQTLLKSSFRPTHRLVVGTSDDAGVVTVSLLDDRTGERVGAPAALGRDYGGVEVDDSGSLVAVGLAPPDPADGDGVVVVLDGDSGDEVVRVVTPALPRRFAFDDAADELVVGLDDGTLATVDLTSGEIVATATTNSSTEFLDLGLEVDGTVVVVSEGQVEFVDRRSGPIRRPVELRGVDGARIRPDGLLWVSRGDSGEDVLDLHSNALVEWSTEVDPFALVRFGTGRAAVVDHRTGTGQVVDLASGERSEVESPDGGALRFVVPEPDGHWAITDAGLLVRRVGGDTVEELELDGSPVSVNRDGDHLAVVRGRPDGSLEVDDIDLVGGGRADVARTVLLRTDTVFAHSTPDEGLVAVERDGTLYVFDAVGREVDRIETELADVITSSLDPTSGRLALSARGGGVALVDLASGEIERIPGVEAVADLGFAGDLLVLTGFDGTVRLWDVERSESAGLVWDGVGARTGSPPWYDAETDSLWVNAGGRVLQISLDPAGWVEQACASVGRTLTQDEWDRFVPGGGEVVSACDADASTTAAVITADAATMPDGQSGDGSTVVIEARVSFEEQPTVGTFDVLDGSGSLGCRSGTLVETLEAERFVNEFTCTEGDRRGTFEVTFEVIDGASGPSDANGPWIATDATGDFDGLAGNGDWAGQASIDGTGGVGVFTGTISFGS